ncbi:MAG TPA: hypothetical protein VN457_07175, partial [Chlamydiales bacterium]|nr:hypothetical protein [Chlamydiales bacterium]
GRYNSEADMLAHKSRDRQGAQSLELQDVSQKLATLKALSSHWLTHQKTDAASIPPAQSNSVPRAKMAVPTKATKAKDDLDEDLSFTRSKPAKKYDAKTEKALEASFFESRKMKEKGQEPVKKSEPLKKKAVEPEKAKPKMRLRPLKKEPVKETKKEKVAPKTKQKALRHLRPAKKR